MDTYRAVVSTIIATALIAIGGTGYIIAVEQREQSCLTANAVKVDRLALDLRWGDQHIATEQYAEGRRKLITDWEADLRDC